MVFPELILSEQYQKERGHLKKVREASFRVVPLSRCPATSYSLSASTRSLALTASGDSSSQ
jgi:hypothetical protein